LLADLDGNGFWDADEVKALFQKELDKMYDPNAPEDDMRERREEMERMREHVYSESDVNKDHLIRQFAASFFIILIILIHYSYEEFLQQTKKKEFEQDQGWQGLDDQKLYTHEEYLEFERKRQEEVQKLIAQGLVSTTFIACVFGMFEFCFFPSLFVCDFEYANCLTVCRV
jgi:nucleobindin